jgi:hypothetical protein
MHGMDRTVLDVGPGTLEYAPRLRGEESGLTADGPGRTFGTED